MSKAKVLLAIDFLLLGAICCGVYKYRAVFLNCIRTKYSLCVFDRDCKRYTANGDLIESQTHIPNAWCNEKPLMWAHAGGGGMCFMATQKRILMHQLQKDSR